MKLTEVMALPDTERHLSSTATVHRFLESLAIQHKQGWITDDEFKSYAVLTLKRGLAICEGDEPLATVIEAEGSALGKAITARQKAEAVV